VMHVTMWGTRGSLAAPGAQTARYGGNTACVEVRSADGSLLVLDAGSGIRDLGLSLDSSPGRIDVLLTHLHMDHIQGLGFFAPMFDSSREVHLWGPMSTTHSLRTRLARYLSPPLFPVYLRDLPWLQLHDILDGAVFEIGPFQIKSAQVCHPDSTFGYRVSTSDATLAYLPDHEPALGLTAGYLSGDWTSGYSLAAGVDLLIHDAQYTEDEYVSRVGWGHSTLAQALDFARLCDVRQLVLFHHNPTHTDDDLDGLIRGAIERAAPRMPVTGGMEHATYELGSIATGGAVRYLTQSGPRPRPASAG
jgi:phosphoribosyl 1,2-cyclic phosphodiesterase